MWKKNIVVLFVWCCISPALHAADTPASVTLQSCYEKAIANYPLVKQRGLIEKSNEYSIANLDKGYLPQVSLNGQASYQSDVTALPLQLPGITVPELARDQYKLYAEFSQAVYNGQAIHKQKELQASNAAVESQKLEVELYKLRERVTQLYFGVLLADAQMQQTDLMKNDIQNGIEKTNAAIQNGIALKSNLDLLKVEMLKADQRRLEVVALREAYLDMLGQLTNLPIDATTVLELPQEIKPGDSIRRPELSLFDMQTSLLNKQEQVITSRNLPRLNLFLQTGYGRPGLNMLSNEFDTWYLGGVRLNWTINGFYTQKKERAILNVNRQGLALQKDAFLFNTQYALKMQNAEISKLDQLRNSDNDIVQLRTKIKTTASAQLENGIITSSEYMREVNAEDQARLAKSLHELQLLMAIYNHLYITGN